uniref:Uncharacterized protein n=1 Tax=Arion vulgaris TaxID=1028688 RepID=A0A0B6Z0S8_9EUPU
MIIFSLRVINEIHLKTCIQSSTVTFMNLVKKTRGQHLQRLEIVWSKSVS